MYIYIYIHSHHEIGRVTNVISKVWTVRGFMSGITMALPVINSEHILSSVEISRVHYPLSLHRLLLYLAFSLYISLFTGLTTHILCGPF